MKKLLLLLPLLIAVGCSSTGGVKPVCDIEHAVADTAVKFVQSTLQCENYDAVYADVFSVVNALHACTSQSRAALFNRGFIADAVCDPLAVKLVDTFTSKVEVLKRWGCKATNAADLLKAGLSSGCKLYFPL